MEEVKKEYLKEINIITIPERNKPVIELELRHIGEEKVMD